jgi:hypothetical protein
VSRVSSHSVIAAPSSAKAMQHRVLAADAIGEPAEERPRRAVGDAVERQRQRQQRQCRARARSHPEVRRERAHLRCHHQPVVDIIVIIANISQEDAALRSISDRLDKSIARVPLRSLCAYAAFVPERDVPRRIRVARKP